MHMIALLCPLLRLFAQFVFDHCIATLDLGGFDGLAVVVLLGLCAGLAQLAFQFHHCSLGLLVKQT